MSDQIPPYYSHPETGEGPRASPPQPPHATSSNPGLPKPPLPRRPEHGPRSNSAESHLQLVRDLSKDARPCQEPAQEALRRLLGGHRQSRRFPGAQPALHSPCPGRAGPIEPLRQASACSQPRIQLGAVACQGRPVHAGQGMRSILIFLRKALLRCSAPAPGVPPRSPLVPVC